MSIITFTGDMSVHGTPEAYIRQVLNPVEFTSPPQGSDSGFNE